VLNILTHTTYGGDSETYDLALSNGALGSGWFGQWGEPHVKNLSKPPILHLFYPSSYCQPIATYYQTHCKYYCNDSG